MTFPTIPTVADGRVAGLNQLNNTATLTGPDLNTLTGRAAGDLVIAIAGEYQSSAGADAAFTGWAGGGLTWTEIRDSTGTTNNRLGVAIARLVTGAETGAVTVTRSGTITAGHDASMILLCISGAHATTNPEATVMATATNAAADPVSLSPSWGAEDTLWIGVNSNGLTSGTGSWTANNSAPTNYTDFFGTAPADTSTIGDFGAAVAFRQLNTASEDMGGFGQDTSNARSAALLIAVRPAPTATTGTASVVLPALAATAAGAVDVEGSASAVLPPLGASLDGTVGSAGITGTAAVVLPPLSATAAGSIDVKGTASVMLPAVAATAVGSIEVAGAVSATLPALGASASGIVEVAGTTTVLLPAVAASLAGTVEVTGVSGTADVVLPAVAASTAGVVEVEGSTSVTLPALGTSAAGMVEVAGSAGIVLPAVDASLAGTVEIIGVAGAVDAVLPALSATAIGAVDVEGTATAALPALAVSLAGAVLLPVEGTVDVILPAMDVVIAGVGGVGPLTVSAPASLHGASPVVLRSGAEVSLH